MGDLQASPPRSPVSHPSSKKIRPSGWCFAHNYAPLAHNRSMMLFSNVQAKSMASKGRFTASEPPKCREDALNPSGIKILQITPAE